MPYDYPDAKGRFGPYGGIFVAETLMHALDELRTAYDKYRVDPLFKEESAYELKHFVGRPSPVYHASLWSKSLRWRPDLVQAERSQPYRRA